MVRGITSLSSVLNRSQSERPRHTSSSSAEKKKIRIKSKTVVINLGNEAVIVGLQNLGNTCYQNAVLQPLVRTPILWDWFCYLFDISKKDLFVSSRSKCNGCIASAFRDLLWEFNKTPRLPIHPKQFRHAMGHVKSQFRDGSQQDAGEFLRKLLEALHDDTDRILTKTFREMRDVEGETAEEASDRWLQYDKKQADSIVHDVFGSQLMTEVKCLTCNYVSRSFERAWSLSVSLTGGIIAGTSSAENVATSLTDCLGHFCRLEVLKPGALNEWRCPKCQKFTSAEKRQTIFRSAPVLILQLNRFMRCNSTGGSEALSLFPTTMMSFASSSNSDCSQQQQPMTRLNNFRKVNKLVKIPIDSFSLGSVPELCGPSHHSSVRQVYDLHGVTHHHGSLSGGHYTCCVKSLKNNRWICYDDSSHYEIREDQRSSRESEIAGRSAYLLFFKSRTLPNDVCENREVVEEVARKLHPLTLVDSLSSSPTRSTVGDEQHHLYSSPKNEEAVFSHKNDRDADSPPCGVVGEDSRGVRHLRRLGPVRRSQDDDDDYITNDDVDETCSSSYSSSRFNSRYERACRPSFTNRPKTLRKPVRVSRKPSAEVILSGASQMEEDIARGRLFAVNSNMISSSPFSTPLSLKPTFTALEETGHYRRIGAASCYNSQQESSSNVVNVSSSKEKRSAIVKKSRPSSSLTPWRR